jgi:hypothetical protein
MRLEEFGTLYVIVTQRHFIDHAVSASQTVLGNWAATMTRRLLLRTSVTRRA